MGWGYDYYIHNTCRDISYICLLLLGSDFSLCTAALGHYRSRQPSPYTPTSGAGSPPRSILNSLSTCFNHLSNSPTSLHRELKPVWTEPTLVSLRFVLNLTNRASFIVSLRVWARNDSLFIQILLRLMHVYATHSTRSFFFCFINFYIVYSTSYVTCTCRINWISTTFPNGNLYFTELPSFTPQYRKGESLDLLVGTFRMSLTNLISRLLFNSAKIIWMT